MGNEIRIVLEDNADSLVTVKCIRCREEFIVEFVARQYGTSSYDERRDKCFCPACGRETKVNLRIEFPIPDSDLKCCGAKEDSDTAEDKRDRMIRSNLNRFMED